MKRGAELAVAVLCGAVAVAGALALGAGAPRIYSNSRFHYRLEVPPNWNISVAESGVVTFFNYDERDSGPQGLFPEPGAEITVIPLDAVAAVVTANTVDEWIAANLTRGHALISRRSLPSGAAQDSARDIVNVEASFERDPQDEQLQHETNYYFTLHGAEFRLRLLYWKGDSSSANYRGACERILRGIRFAP
jgi:hypothetical protein